ncbi:hypothetical protein KIN20_013551 [Parelaphostrongylus tenuis]|uniref:Uncharacterized protein n=1 Tax=Parelaphostrongylus tenuis TaxID=148309 RepID=A0AAD5MXQ6_PARTN|nr:hypothetical protein KIN20_013551 [Parelaphostrongylus tenuis]
MDFKANKFSYYGGVDSTYSFASRQLSTKSAREICGMEFINRSKLKALNLTHP